MSKNPHYDPEQRYRQEVINIEAELKREGTPETQIDEALFVIECLALRMGNKSYLKDVNNRLSKYLDVGLALPIGMAKYLSTQLQCISNGEDANNVFYVKGGRGTKHSNSLRNREIFDFLKGLDNKVYSLNGSSKKESGFQYAAENFNLSLDMIRNAYKDESNKIKIIKTLQNKIDSKKMMEILKGFEEYQATGGKLGLIDYVETVIGLKK